MDLTYLNNTSIELVRAVDGKNIRHAVLDFDGTLSLIRDGWQNVMVPMMVEILAQTPTIEVLFKYVKSIWRFYQLTIILSTNDSKGENDKFIL